MTEECPYCGEEFDDVNERGEHIADEHVDPSSSIPKVSEAEQKKKNRIREWEKNTDNSNKRGGGKQ